MSHSLGAWESGWFAGVPLGAAGIGPWALLTSATAWALLLAPLALWLMLPRSSAVSREVGAVIGLASLGLFAADMPLLSNLAGQNLFWILAGVTLVAAAAAVSMQSAVYAAVWFALSLLGTAGLFMLQEAQFLGVATVVVYAGAIVVTFLFVLMLAQPEGHATYDRVSWGWYTKPVSAVAAAALVALLTFTLSGLREGGLRAQIAGVLPELVDPDGAPLVAPALRGFRLSHPEPGTFRVTFYHRDAALRHGGDEADVAELQRLRESLRQQLSDRIAPLQYEDLQVEFTSNDVMHPNHMAHLGSYLFTQHLVSVEVAGTLLLVALVGAVAIMIQGKDEDTSEEGRTDE